MVQSMPPRIYARLPGTAVHMHVLQRVKEPETSCADAAYYYKPRVDPLVRDPLAPIPRVPVSRTPPPRACRSSIVNKGTGSFLTSASDPRDAPWYSSRLPSVASATAVHTSRSKRLAAPRRAASVAAICAGTKDCASHVAPRGLRQPSSSCASSDDGYQDDLIDLDDYPFAIRATPFRQDQEQLSIRAASLDHISSRASNFMRMSTMKLG